MQVKRSCSRSLLFRFATSVKKRGRMRQRTSFFTQRMREGSIFSFTHPDFPGDEYIGCSLRPAIETLKRHKATCIDGCSTPLNSFHTALLSMKMTQFDKFEITVLEPCPEDMLKTRRDEYIQLRNPSWNVKNRKTQNMKEYQRNYQRTWYAKNQNKVLKQRLLKRLEKVRDNSVPSVPSSKECTDSESQESESSRVVGGESR